MLKVLVGMSLSSFFMGLFGVDWQTVDRKIARAFPAVEFVSTESLLAEAQLRVAPTIIDVRLPEEYDVSHIPKAHNLQSAEAIAAAFPDYAEPIVVYCSVGYRSAAVAEELASLGYTSVKISGIRFSNGQSAVMVWKTPPAARQKSIPTAEPGEPYSQRAACLFALKGPQRANYFHRVCDLSSINQYPRMHRR